MLEMRIAVGADHAGFALKEHLKSALGTLGHEYVDFGAANDQPSDYPPICAAVGRAVAGGHADRGIVLGGSGQGEQIAANKVSGVRAALCNDIYTARLSRQHNDANVLAIGARIVAPDLAREILTLWLATPFEGGRHQRRVEQIAALERP
jgi:ribose 5-phosphate isomerase B